MCIFWDLRKAFDKVPRWAICTKLSRLRSTTKTSIISARELQYADNNATLNWSPEHLQQTRDLYVDTYQRVGMQDNTEKTKLLAQLPPNQATLVANAQTNDHPVESMDNFTYLGSILSRTVTCEKDIEKRIQAAHSAYGRLAHRAFTNHGLTMHTKTMVLRAVVLSTLLYACETWTLYKRDIKRLENFQQSKLRYILLIHENDCITNNEVLSSLWRAASADTSDSSLPRTPMWLGTQLSVTLLPCCCSFSSSARVEKTRTQPKEPAKSVKGQGQP
ncbi:uncharacterized protein LOC143028112 [Oratosquilla oratoria]|uniref:uncharacterized protein LOC143028112 n=1 Tax=Oratosquilla oratoria TaxID=337810 RepID=UPI003F759ED1